MQSERGKGRGLARGHTFLLTQVFFQQAGGPAGDKDGAAPWAVLAASAAPSAAVPGVGRARCPRPVLHPGTFQQRQRAAVPMPSPQHSSNLTHHSQPWKKECGICHCNCFPSFLLWTELSPGFPWQDFAWLRCSPQGWAEDPICKQDLAWVGSAPPAAITALTQQSCFGSRLSCSINTLKLLEHSAPCQESQGGSRRLMAAPKRTKHPHSSSTLSSTSFWTCCCDPAPVTQPRGTSSPPVPTTPPQHPVLSSSPLPQLHTHPVPIKHLYRVLQHQLLRGFLSFFPTK